MSKTDGETPLTEAELAIQAAKAMECAGSGDGRRMAHSWIWYYEQGVWTDKQVCQRCGGFKNVGSQS